MREFTGFEYIKIDLANHYGLDRLTWDERLEWVDRHTGHLDIMAGTAKEPVLYRKALRAFHAALNQEPTGFIMGLDATASGLQILACLSGCHATARNVNLINTGEREDAYESTAVTMTKYANSKFEREVVKHPLMTTFYGSTEQPKSVFGDGTPELEAFYETLQTEFPGALEAMNDIQSCWQPDAYAHSWTLPDGHTAYVPVMSAATKTIEIDELEHLQFTQQIWVNEPSEFGISLCANVVHSIDGYVVREMRRRARNQMFEVLSIHDSFWASPNHMNKVRKNYIDILAEIAESNLLQDILRQITGDHELIHTKLSYDLADKIRESEYPLS